MAHVALSGARVTTALYALSLHASEFTVGTLIALFAFFPMLFSVSLGRLIDRIGVRKPMMCGVLAIALGCLIPAVIGGLPVLYLSGMLIGTGFTAIHIGSQHTTGAMSTNETRSARFSGLSLGFSTSSFFGPIIAGVVIDHAHYKIAFAVFCGVAAIALIILARSNWDRVHVLPHGLKRKSGSPLELLRDRDMRRIYLVGILLAAAWDLFTFVTPIQGSRLGFSASTIGLILGVFSLATFTVRLIMPWLARRFTEWHILTGALLLAVASYALIPFMQQPWSMMMVAAGLGLALGSSQPNVLALLHNAAPAGRGGEAIGIRATMGNGCQFILPIAFGAAGATLGLFAVFWGMAAMIGVGIPIAWRKAFVKIGGRQ